MTKIPSNQVLVLSLPPIPIIRLTNANQSINLLKTSSAVLVGGDNEWYRQRKEVGSTTKLTNNRGIGSMNEEGTAFGGTTQQMQ